MIGSAIAFLFRLLTGAMPRWRGCAPELRQRLYFANHSSNLDFILLWTALPRPLRRQTRPVAARDYWTANGLRHWLATRVFQALLIERRNVTRENNPLEPMLAELRGGSSLILFPEGGRHLGDEMAPFKPGLFHIARALPELDLVPVYIENLSRVLPKGEILPVPILCSVHFGCPLRLETGETKPVFLARARQAIVELRQA